ncbi:MAG: adenine phosphoribosyltransferase [Spirochaetota bacterium]|nr:adenine phosphoribosyltransferase [Spirochaetota bacterium]
MNLKSLIRDIPDFPKKGIIFKDITTLWMDPKGLKTSTDELAKRYKDKGINKIVAAESRGFIVGTPLAYLIGAGFVPVRKPGKLPYKVISESYDLEYGSDTLTIHEDAIKPGEKVLIVDDLIATGGTIEAIIKLVEKLGGEVIEVCALVELSFLKGRERINKPIFNLIEY